MNLTMNLSHVTARTRARIARPVRDISDKITTGDAIHIAEYAAVAVATARAVNLIAGLFSP